MFESARLKLTAWYLLLIMLVSLSFSAVIYNAISTEINRFARMQRFRIERKMVIPFPSDVPRLPSLDPDLVDETKARVLLILGAINAGIFVIAGGLGYFLAGRTLRPIQEMLDEQNRFIADASHELRTPITALKSNIEVTLMENKVSPTDAKKVLQDGLRDVNQLQSLSDALLQLAQYQSPQPIRTKTTIEISEVVKEAVQSVQPQAKQKKIKIKNSVQTHKIPGDTQSLQELFVILLDNAIKYSPESSEIVIGSHVTDGIVVLNVKDTGIGIPEEDLPHVFDRFYRVDKSRSKNTVAGYGLGLSIAKKIVETHHGSIQVLSTLNEGTEFKVKLPRKFSE